MVGEVQPFAHIGQEVPEGIAFDEHGNPTRDPNAALRGGWVPFGGHKGYGLSFESRHLDYSPALASRRAKSRTTVFCSSLSIPS